MVRITKVKLCLTLGILPKKYPAKEKETTHKMFPIIEKEIKNNLKYYLKYHRNML